MIKSFKYSYLLLVIFSFFCISCVHNSHPFQGNIELDRVNNKNEKMGIVLIRPMFMHFIYKRNVLTHSNKLMIYAVESSKASSLPKEKNLLKEILFTGAPNPFSHNNYIELSERGKVDGIKIEDKIFSSKSSQEKGGFGFMSPSTYTLEYFYGLTMLPEGKYYIADLFAKTASIEYIFNYKHENQFYYFEVKAGYVNYLGDFYISSPKHVGGIFSSKNQHIFKIIDKPEQAQNFFKKYYGNINLPFTQSLIKCCESF